MKRSPTALFAVLGALALAFCQWLIYVYAPEEQVMGLVQKIFYIHLPLAWWGLISFGVSCIAGIAYLKSGKVKYDLLSASAVEIGMLTVELAVKLVGACVGGIPVHMPAVERFPGGGAGVSLFGAEELAALEFKVESDDPYWEKLQEIEHGWNISFGLYGGDPDLPDGGPAGNWMGIRPVHCREVVALFINFTYMIDMQEHEEILKANEDILYGNGGVDDKVTAEKVLSQMRQQRTLQVGLVYPGNGVIGLGGGNVFGAYQHAWLTHYTNTYACEIMFHELGHVMGYNHSSSFTYGPWAQQLMNNFYVNNLHKFPIDSASYLDSKNNPTLY